MAAPAWTARCHRVEDVVDALREELLGFLEGRHGDALRAGSELPPHDLGHLLVLTWGRKHTPSASIRDCMRAILRFIRGTSTNAAGVRIYDGCKPPPSIKVFPARPQRRDITLQPGRDQLRYLAGGQLIGLGEIDPHRLHLPSQAGIGNRRQAKRVVEVPDDRRRACPWERIRRSMRGCSRRHTRSLPRLRPPAAAGSRRSVRTASALILPPATCASAVVDWSHMTSICPPIRSFIAGATPR